MLKKQSSSQTLFYSPCFSMFCSMFCFFSLLVEFVVNGMLEGMINFGLEDCMKIFPLKNIMDTHLNM